MKYLDLTFPAPAANLACDEALLDACDENPDAELLRFWEPADYFVVLGYANHTSSEVNTAACRARNIPILRRCSGGGTIIQGPGCLNYSLILRLDRHDALQTIPGANCHIMEQHRQALERLLASPVKVEGITDLSLGQMKFSGNAQRRKRNALLFHGTFLLGLDIGLIQTLLPMPSRKPDYRQARPHNRFLANLPIASTALKAALRQTWSAAEPLALLPQIPPTLVDKYESDAWNLKF